MNSRLAVWNFVSGKTGSIEKKVKKNFPEEYEQIKSITVGDNFKSKLYLWVYQDASYECIKCGKTTTINRLTTGFLKYCSPQCRGQAKRSKPVKKAPEKCPSLYPSFSDVEKLITQHGLNYYSSRIRSEYNDFYLYVKSNSEGKHFTEKLFNFYGKSKTCEFCNVKQTRITIIGKKPVANRFCSRVCANRHNSIFMTGGYNEHYFQMNPTEKNKSGCLYFVKFINKDNGEFFYKIGMTSRSFKKRLYEITNVSLYDFEIINEVEGKLYELHLKEKNILLMLKDKMIQPLNINSGKTECFIENEDIVCQMMT